MQLYSMNQCKVNIFNVFNKELFLYTYTSHYKTAAINPPRDESCKQPLSHHIASGTLPLLVRYGCVNCCKNNIRDIPGTFLCEAYHFIK